jgi:hypothetical protein
VTRLERDVELDRRSWRRRMNWASPPTHPLYSRAGNDRCARRPEMMPFWCAVLTVQTDLRKRRAVYGRRRPADALTSLIAGSGAFLALMGLAHSGRRAHNLQTTKTRGARRCRLRAPVRLGAGAVPRVRLLGDHGGHGCVEQPRAAAPNRPRAQPGFYRDTLGLAIYREFGSGPPTCGYAVSHLRPTDFSPTALLMASI